MRQNQQHGFGTGPRVRRGALALSLAMTVMVFALMSMSVLGMSTVIGRTVHRRQAHAQALNLAMGAADMAVANLREDEDYTGFDIQDYGPGQMSATITQSAEDALRYEVVGTGVVTGSDYEIERQVRIRLAQQVVADVFYQALAAKETFALNGTVTVNSQPALGQGNVHSNGDVQLIGSPISINGAVTAVGSVNASGTATVTQGIEENVEPVEFPTINQAFKDQSLSGGVRMGSLSVGDGRLLRGKIQGDLTIGPFWGARVEGVVWVTGNVTINGPVTGTGTIVCDGRMQLSANRTYLPTDMNNVAFITTSPSPDALVLTGSSQFKGLLYAPEGNIRVFGSPTLIGGMLAKNLTISGTPTISKWTNFDLSPPPLPKSYDVLAWEEL